ncbi:hypothetical protein [Nitrosomonas sp. Nm33]|uniref:hypothetical protein n=1 Tax=Nitrosomonas sp. Nm33 TaxID=133724 RepID=UPI00089B9D74|nr:hypothetical protein [Nitrosomonas sp. Nm33]SDY92225.1 hypothetical protein SAMN05421755_106510 [Nitrosomonas sp. Nm33]
MLKKEIIKLRAALPMLLASLSADRRAFMDSNSNSDRLSNTLTSTDSHSKNAIYNTASLINLDNPFFKSLRENDRSGTSYNVPSQVWTIIPKRIQTILEKNRA